ncbi:MAG TPA: M1 family aminopeptidase [Nitrospirales bacterium]|jgi:hypothetical protein
MRLHGQIISIIVLLGLLLNSCQFANGTAPAEAAHPSSGQDIKLLNHYMQVERLVLDQHRLVAADQIYLEVLAPTLKSISFTLHPSLRVKFIDDATANKGALRGHPFLSFTTHEAQVDNQDVQIVTVQLKSPAVRGEKLILQWVYEGIINDPPREPRHLRFVTPSETSGHIGKEGVYLSGETHWYPDIPGSLTPFGIIIWTPPGWEAVTNGKFVSRNEHEPSHVEWQITEPTEALTLVANRFVKNQRDWNDASGRQIEVATYLFPDEAHLADEYLKASIQYLEAYTKLLGPYPFPKFAVVENFFASGLGMPSYTLLGAGSIKRRYIQPYALGHEIVHSWIGNYVYNDHGGNWVEGLTTYLANYYWYELQADTGKARDERRMMLITYAVYVPPDQDYPIVQFKQKADQRDSAIGYSKAAMVFHMLRWEIGDAAFFSALKRLVGEYGGRRAGWRDLETVFSQAASRDLRAFFARWIEERGALDVPQAEDPDFNLFRRIPRSDLPAMLNLFVTDSQRMVILPSGDPETVEPYRRIADRVSKQDGVKIQSAANPELPRLDSASILLLGGPAASPVFDWAKTALPVGTNLEPKGFRVGGKEYRGAGNAVLFSVRNPDNPEHVVTLFYGLSPDASNAIAPLLFFYGWNTFVVFENGKVISRGDLEPRKP